MSYVIGFITNTPSRSYRKRQVASVTLHVVHHVVDGYEPFATHTTMGRTSNVRILDLRMAPGLYYLTAQ